MKVKGRCGHIIEGVEIFDSTSDDEFHISYRLCPDCFKKSVGKS